MADTAAVAWAERYAAWPRAARLLTPVALGAVAALGHASHPLSFGLFLLAVSIAFVILPSGRAGRFGWLLGLGYFAMALRWIVEPFLVDVARHGWMAPFALVLMAGGLALFWGIAFRLASWLGRGGPATLVWLPVTLAAAELARGHIFTGFPWALPSYTLIGQYTDLWLAIIGPYGLTLVLLGVAALWALSLRDTSSLRPLGAMVVVIVVLFAAPSLLDRTPAQPASDATVRIIQPNAPQHLKWDREWMPVFFDRAIALTMEGEPADVVIWPETSVPSLLNFAEPWREQMALAARGAPVVAGIQREELGAYYNSAFVQDGPGDLAEVYDKEHLVPFGEYIPLAWLLEPIGLGVLVEQVAGFTPGAGPDLVQVDGLGLVRILICYEGIFPEEIQRGDQRADVLLILTNDAWFGNGPGPRQHLQQAQARAIEQGLPVIRSANTGISAIISPRGRIVDSLPLNEAGALDGAVPPALPSTPYAKLGDWPLTVLLAGLLGLGAWLRRRFAIDATGTQA